MKIQPKRSQQPFPMALAESAQKVPAPLRIAAKTKEETIELPVTFSKQGFTFEQVIRNGWKALYRKKLNGLVVGYELFYIRIQKPSLFKGVQFQTKERYPHDEAFGKWAWSIIGRDEKKALSRFLNLNKA